MSSDGAASPSLPWPTVSPNDILNPYSTGSACMPREQNGTSIIIRRLRLSEVGSFASLRAGIEREAAHLVASSGERKEGIAYVLLRIFINRKRMHTFVAEKDGRLVGFITVLFPKFRKLRKNAYLTLSVLKSERGKGIGTRLIGAAEAFAKERSE